MSRGAVPWQPVTNNWFIHHFVPSGYWSPCGALVWNEGFPSPSDGSSICTTPPIKINESLVKRLAFASQGQLAPLSAVFGGIAAQEAMKAITFTFTPINQWLYIHCASIVPLEVSTKSNEFQK
ncbi:unnamed protein product [Schistosoma mattheei]|uniref:Uncharacterized protein n=1 Tax=Schistosoma mattheei TaxID=31246 RepID=A0A183PRM1_9TREM|nr:unnamed protein product [Schistosoma mattheei]